MKWKKVMQWKKKANIIAAMHARVENAPMSTATVVNADTVNDSMFQQIYFV
jgi:hypothetical protein